MLHDTIFRKESEVYCDLWKEKALTLA